MGRSFDRATKHYGAAAIAAAASFLCLSTDIAQAAQAPQVRLGDGIVEGAKMRGQHKDVRVFRGIPYAAPPVGDFRFREPQPVARWAGVLGARQFGPRCMQPDVGGKLDFRSTAMSEDCLYLNVWAPANGAEPKLPVLVYFHGGGFVMGDGSETRYDGANLASRGIVAVTVNYRLGALGFLAPAGASSESSHGTAGNYGLLDQVAALRWVRDNIAQFGGDPSKVTIAGNSAGSVSVSAHMASPLSRGLFARAIGQSGAAFGPNGLWTRQEAERAANTFSARVGATSLQQLRSMPARTLHAASLKPKLDPEPMTFRPSIDGYFLTESPEQVFTRGGQTQVPLLLGSNSPGLAFIPQPIEDAPILRNQITTLRERIAKVRSHAQAVLAHYPGDDNVNQSTARWMDLHRQTGQAPVFSYRYAQPLPRELGGPSEPSQPMLGAAHDIQVDYSLGNLDDGQRRYAWTAADYDVSRIFSRYVEQFVKTGDPNGAPLRDGSSLSNAGQQSMSYAPNWPAVRVGNEGTLLQVIGAKTHSIWDRNAPPQGLAQP